MKPYAPLLKALVRRKSVIFSQKTLGENVALLNAILNVSRHWLENNIFKKQSINNNEENSDHATRAISELDGTDRTDGYIGYDNMSNGEAERENDGLLSHTTKSVNESESGSERSYSNINQPNHSPSSVVEFDASALNNKRVAQ